MIAISLGEFYVVETFSVLLFLSHQFPQLIEGHFCRRFLSARCLLEWISKGELFYGSKRFTFLIKLRKKRQAEEETSDMTKHESSLLIPTSEAGYFSSKWKCGLIKKTVELFFLIWWKRIAGNLYSASVNVYIGFPSAPFPFSIGGRIRKVKCLYPQKWSSLMVASLTGTTRGL